jgi:hypothetical protein
MRGFASRRVTPPQPCGDRRPESVVEVLAGLFGFGYANPGNGHHLAGANMARNYLTVSLTLLALTAPLAACQTPEESATSAEQTCLNQGLRPGTKQYRRCVDATYVSNRQQSQQAANATAAGVAVAVVGGALLGAAIDDNDGYYYHHHHYYHHGYHHW